MQPFSAGQVQIEDQSAIDGLEKFIAIACWSRATIFTTNFLLKINAAVELEVLAIENKIKGGSNDTDENEFTVTPIFALSAFNVVITATPVP